MPELLRFKMVLSNFPGSPGVNTIYTTTDGVPSLGTISGLLEDAYDSVKQKLWQNSKVDLDPEVAEIDVASGDLKAVHVAPTWTITGTGSVGAGTTATQGKLRFQTDQLVPATAANKGPRILKGGVYIGPLSDDAMTGGGTLSVNTIEVFSAMFDGLMDVQGSRLVVWHRPKQRAGGAFGHVQEVSVMPKPAILRSRRD